jgi:hypothetical protein
MEKRKNLRIPMKNLWVDIADGVGFSQGVVSDVSRFGICMTGMPKRLNGDAERMTVVVSGNVGRFTLNVKTKWHTYGGTRRFVGVEIMDVPGDWIEFVSNSEALIHKDVKGEIRL